MSGTLEQKSGQYQIPRAQTTREDVIKAAGYVINERDILILINPALAEKNHIPEGNRSIGITNHEGKAYVNYRDNIVLLEEAVRLKELFDLNHIPYTETPPSEKVAERLTKIAERLRTKSN